MEHLSTFVATRAAIESGTTTVERVVETYLERIENKKRLNAFLSVFPEKALTQARRVDEKIVAGNAGKLAGMVVAVKDVLCLKDEVVTCGSKILQNFTSLYDATAVRRLQQEDAVVIGKTNMDEFAMGSSTENSAYG
ncbi:MAG: amidase family protein, partial [bacterium]